MLHFMPEGQFYAKQFSAWAGFTPAKGGGEVLGEACELARNDFPQYFTTKAPWERKVCP
jgi:hypothetical protein